MKIDLATIKKKITLCSSENLTINKESRNNKIMNFRRLSDSILVNTSNTHNVALSSSVSPGINV